MTANIRVLVVDDSPTVCRLLLACLGREPDLTVVGSALSGEQAIVLAKQLRPDVIVLDLKMSGIGGQAAIEQIMQHCPTPIVVISGVGSAAIENTITALQCGAVDYLAKYDRHKRSDPVKLQQTLVNKIRIAASVKLHTAHSGSLHATSIHSRQPANSVVIIGASTGGPTAIQQVLEMLPKDFPAGVIVVQHLPRTFTRAMALQLDRVTSLSVREASPHDFVEGGVVLLAPGDRHLVLGRDGRINLTEGDKVCGHRPSIDVAFHSAALAFGSRATGVLLTGMGNDGASGLLALKRVGAMTLVQNEASSVVYGMPRRAFELGAATHVDHPARLGQHLLDHHATLEMTVVRGAI
jgi:two-component system, chemotaxis family, protein-glutamate methylesterase/glutaminase